MRYASVARCGLISVVLLTCSSKSTQQQAPAISPELAQELRTLPSGTVLYKVHLNKDYLEANWLYVKACSGLREQKGGHLSDVNFYAVTPGALGQLAFGRWVYPNSILLDSLWTDASWVVRHELLHHLMRGENGKHEVHPAKPFIVPCALTPEQELGPAAQAWVIWQQYVAHRARVDSIPFNR